MEPYAFVATGMATFDPVAQGESVGPNVLLAKLLATGAVTITQALFMPWRSYKHYMKKQQKYAPQQLEQQQQEQQQLTQQPLAIEDATMLLAIQPYTPGGTSAESPDATTQLGYNYDMLDEQEVAQKQFPQLMAEFRNLRSQISQQKQNNLQLQRQCDHNSTVMQKMQLGMDNRDQAKNKQIQQLQQPAFAHGPPLLAFPEVAAEHYIPHSSASVAAEHARATIEGTSFIALLKGALIEIRKREHCKALRLRQRVPRRTTTQMDSFLARRASEPASDVWLVREIHDRSADGQFTAPPLWNNPAHMR